MRLESPVSVIVSASYRTDIPAFYAGWFMRRLEAGSCRVANPYGGPAYEVRLTPDAVDGFVFWTRNLRPLLGDLDGVREVAPFTVQFTLTGYPRALESSVIGAEEGVAQMREHLIIEGEARTTAQVSDILKTVEAFMESVRLSSLGGSGFRGMPGSVPKRRWYRPARCMPTSNPAYRSLTSTSSTPAR